MVPIFSSVMLYFNIFGENTGGLLKSMHQTSNCMRSTFLLQHGPSRTWQVSSCRSVTFYILLLQYYTEQTQELPKVLIYVAIRVKDNSCNADIFSGTSHLQYLYFFFYFFVIHVDMELLFWIQCEKFSCQFYQSFNSFMCLLMSIYFKK